MWRVGLVSLLLLAGCAGIGAHDDMTIVSPTRADLYSVATIQKITDKTAPVHIYIEGDGHSFNNYGRATDDPTPRSHFVRDLAAADNAPNVAYIARPCQFVMDEKCKTRDWTTGRFSKSMVDSVAFAIKTIAGTRPVILIGYSGGAMISGLVIQNHAEIDVKKWITVAGVLNHADWTQYFNDTPLSHSLNLYTLPRIAQVHYVAENDEVVPNILSQKWISDQKMIVISGAKHNTIPVKALDFTN